MSRYAIASVSAVLESAQGLAGRSAALGLTGHAAAAQLVVATGCAGSPEQLFPVFAFRALGQFWRSLLPLVMPSS